MKKCPYCAEEIQDEAILCRYCKSDLTVPPPAGAASRSAGSATAGGASPASPEAADAAPAESSSPASSEPTPSSTTGPPDTFAFGPGARSSPSPADRASSADEADSSATAEGSSTESDIASTTFVGPPGPGEASSADTPPEAEAYPAATPPEAEASRSAEPAVAGPVTYSHSGHRYVLGYGSDFFGIWDRQAPASPVERFPRTDDGWRQAWQRYAGLEPGNVAVAAAEGQPSTTAPAGSGQAMQYTHSGQRYLLGYGVDFFGIWDRQNLAMPVQRYPRTDDGWRAAWQQFATWEPQSSEVGIGGSG